MGGLSFVDDVDVSADTALLPIFSAWLTDLAGGKATNTVRAYLSDIAMVAQVLLENSGRPVPGPDVVPPSVRVPAGVSPVTVARAAALVDRLTLGDLHPALLAQAFSDFGSSVPHRRRSPGGPGAEERRRDATRRRAAAAWTMLCEYATNHGLLAANPMRDPRIGRGGRPAHNPAPFELSEASRLLDVVATPDVARTSRRPWPARDVALLSVMLTSGVRLAEACSVNVGDVRDIATAPHMHVVGKGNKHRTIPLSGATRDEVLTYLAERANQHGEPQSGDALFVKADGSRFSPRSMEHLVYRWYQRAGIAPHGESCVHALRHTFATQLVNSGASIVEVQELLGHASLETTKRYLRSVGHGLRDAVEAHPGTALVRDRVRPGAAPARTD